MKRIFALSLLFGLICGPAQAALWSTTEIHYQRGELEAPGFAGGGDADTDIFTFQHAAGWEYVEVFLFIDVIDDDKRDGFNDSDLYGEVYFGGGLSKAFGHEGGIGPWRDVGWVFGVNAGRDPKVRKYLPGIRLYWDAPGFAFLNTDITAYIDDNRGVDRGGAPSESDSFMVDFSWLYLFNIGEQAFSLTGHAEYIDGRRNEFGGEVSSWVLAQPQFRWDAGKTFWGEQNRFFLGIEYQYWRNKLGDPNTDEHAAQFLAVWQF